jgi:hypothetical protein
MLAARLRPDAATRPPGDRSLLDDVAMRRPWNVRVKAARWRARLRVRRLRPGVTVIVVNWNTCDVTADVISAVQHFSPPGTELLLIDNGSTDASRGRFTGWPGIKTVFLRSNAGHGVALDLGVCWTRTKVAVALDSDAIPLRHGWLEPAVDPVRQGEALLAGLRSRRGFVHPVYLAVDTATFVRQKLSFQVHRDPQSDDGVADEWGVNAWDTGELMTPRVPADRVRFVDPAPNRAVGLPGMTVGDVVYHHGGVSRDGSGAVSAEAFTAWRVACDANGIGAAVLDDRQQVGA